MRLKSTALLLSLMIVTITLSGCGGTADPSPSPTSIPPTAPPVTLTATPAKQSTNKLPTDSVIIAKSDRSTVSVIAISLFDGSQEVISNFPSTGIRLFDSPFHRQVFDKTYARVATTWKDESSQSVHVGWVTAQGKRVDVTEAVSGPGGFSKGPRHYNPLFDPFSGRFFYVDQTAAKAVWVDTETFHITRQLAFDGWDEEDFQRTNFFIGAAGNLDVWRHNFPQSIQAPGGKKGVISSSYDSFIGWLPPDKMIYVNWDKNRIAIKSTGDLTNCNQGDCRTYITPETDYRLLTGVSNVDSGKVVFTAKMDLNSGIFSVFVSNIDGSGEPKAIAEFQGPATFMHVVPLEIVPTGGSASTPMASQGDSES